MKAFGALSLVLAVAAAPALVHAQEAPPPEPEAQPKPARVGLKMRCVGKKVRVHVTSSEPTRYVDFLAGRKRVGRDRKKPFVRVIAARRRDLGARVRLRDGRTFELGRSRPGCG